MKNVKIPRKLMDLFTYSMSCFSAFLIETKKAPPFDLSCRVYYDYCSFIRMHTSRIMQICDMKCANFYKEILLLIFSYISLLTLASLSLQRILILWDLTINRLPPVYSLQSSFYTDWNGSDGYKVFIQDWFSPCDPHLFAVFCQDDWKRYVEMQY